MYAIIESGGKQLRVEKDRLIRVEKLNIPEGEKVEFHKVLFVNDGSSCFVGTPYLEHVSVMGTVVSNIRGEKVIVFKHKRRKNYRRRQGHRQMLTVVKIDDIKAN